MSDTVERDDRDLARAEFLGPEFLLWLWYRSEEGFGRLSGASGMELDLWLEDRLALQGDGEKPQRVDLRGGAPGGSAAARTALLEGQKVVAARYGIRIGELEYTLELHQDLSVRGLKIPETGADEEDLLAERMRLTEEIFERIDDLFEAFVQARLHPSWDTAVVPRVTAWLTEDLRPVG